jgi:hypothetical protein
VTDVAALERTSPKLHRAAAIQGPPFAKCRAQLSNLGPGPGFVAPYPPHPLAFLRGATHAAGVPRRRDALPRARGASSPLLYLPTPLLLFNRTVRVMVKYEYCRVRDREWQNSGHAMARQWDVRGQGNFLLRFLLRFKAVNYRIAVLGTVGGVGRTSIH